jgi:nucleoside-diphosphate-sugar epimerase
MDSAGKRIFVTGGGFSGWHLTRALCDAGARHKFLNSYAREFPVVADSADESCSRRKRTLA